MLFAAIGRMSHSSSDGSVLTTAGPFLLAWFTIAPLLGGYKNVSSRKALLLSTALPWAVSVPIGVALRGLIQGYMPAVPFWIIAMTATALLIGVWRLIEFQIMVMTQTVDQFVEAILDDDD